MTPPFVPLSLDEDEQVTLLGLMLVLMNDELDELALKGDSQRLRLRRARRNQLRFERWKTVEGRGSNDQLEIEDLTVLETRLAAPRTVAHAVQLLVAACAYQPFAGGMPKDAAGTLSAQPREQRLEWAAKALPEVSPAAITHITKRVERKFGRSKASTATWVAVLGGGLAVGALTAGIAAPAVAGAVGGLAGLQGAAAVSAGLAAFGGGSLAAGGMGMAGGTAVSAAGGGLGGAGLAALGAEAAGRTQLASEISQLCALVEQTERMDAATRVPAGSRSRCLRWRSAASSMYAPGTWSTATARRRRQQPARCRRSLQSVDSSP